jgi:hypothetical protein
MILAAHQPSFLPWLGYLDKMARADVFVVMDDLQYEAQNFQNRNRVKLPGGPSWVTVPLLRGSQSDRILDKRIDNGGSARQHWQRRIWLTLEHNYRKTAHFADYAPELHLVFSRQWDRLIDLDLEMLGLARQWLGIDTPLRLSSELGLRGEKTDRILHMCQRLGATEYLSGRGGSTGYLDVAQLERAGVRALWQEFEHPTYPQRYPELGFVPYLAFLDLLFNCGPRSQDVLFGSAPALPHAKAS